MLRAVLRVKGLLLRVRLWLRINGGDDTKDPLGALASITSFGIGGFAVIQLMNFSSAFTDGVPFYIGG
jgi:hypothetical protein